MKISKTFLFAMILLTVPSAATAQYTHGGLFSAARAGNVDAVKHYLKKETDPNTLNQALGTAIIGNQLKIMDMLIAQGADVNHRSSYNTPLLINAIMFDRPEAAKLLIQKGADVNIRGYNRLDHEIYISWDWTPLMCATYKGDIEMVKLLLKEGADIHANGWSSSSDDPENAVDIAAYSGHFRIFNYLIKRGAQLHEETFFKVIRSGELAVAAILLPEQKDINRLGTQLGKTALMESCTWDHIDLVRLLLEHGAATNLLSEDGLTALGYTAMCLSGDCPNQMKIAKQLLDAGANPNRAGLFKMTPMMSAVAEDNEELIKLLSQFE